MTNPSFQASTMAFMTPRVKKRSAASSTTTGRKMRRVGSPAMTMTAPRSEVKGRTPKVTMTPRTSLMKQQQRLCFTPSAGDRFIPNRAKTDAVKARRSLFQAQQSAKTTTKAPQSQSEADYSCQLGKVLFGADDDCNGLDCGSFMSFGAMATPQRLDDRVVSKKDVPSDHQLLPHDVLSQARRQAKSKAEQNAVNISFLSSLDAPGMIHDTDVSLMDCEEDFMAVALNDKVYLRDNSGRTELVAHVPGYAFSCVRFSEDGELLALGQNESLQIYGFWEGEEPSKEYELFNDSGYVTAVAWKGTQIVAASDDGIKRCDLSQRNPLPTTYVGHGEDVPVTALEWNGNTIASAGADGKIRLWDANATGDAVEPRCTMDHPGVRSIEFCPQQPDLLVSGGDSGLRFWKIRNGELKAIIETETPVVGTMFSKAHKEICVVDEEKLTVWSLGSKVTKLAEKEVVTRHEDSIITGMARGPKGTVVVSTDEEALSLYRIDRKVIGKERRTTGSEFGGLQMPVIR